MVLATDGTENTENQVLIIKEVMILEGFWWNWCADCLLRRLVLCSEALLRRAGSGCEGWIGKLLQA